MSEGMRNLQFVAKKDELQVSAINCKWVQLTAISCNSGWANRGHWRVAGAGGRNLFAREREESIRDIRDIRDKADKTEGFLNLCIRDSIRDIRDIRDRAGSPESKVQGPVGVGVGSPPFGSVRS